MSFKIPRNPTEALDRGCGLCARRVIQDIIECPSADCPFWPYRRVAGPEREPYNKFGPKLKAIHEFCLDCCEGNIVEVLNCNPYYKLGHPCPLHKYRMGRGTKKRSLTHPLRLPLEGRQTEEELEKLMEDEH